MAEVQDGGNTNLLKRSLPDTEDAGLKKQRVVDGVETDNSGDTAVVLQELDEIGANITEVRSLTCVQLSGARENLGLGRTAMIARPASGAMWVARVPAISSRADQCIVVELLLSFSLDLESSSILN